MRGESFYYLQQQKKKKKKSRLGRGHNKNRHKNGHRFWFHYDFIASQSAALSYNCRITKQNYWCNFFLDIKKRRKKKVSSTDKDMITQAVWKSSRMEINQVMTRISIISVQSHVFITSNKSIE